MQGKTLIIRWGLNEDILFNYLISSERNVIKDGFILSKVNADRAIKILRKIIERNKIENLIVENNAFLNSVRAASDGHDVSETSQWGKKLRSIDRIYQSIIGGEIQVPFEVKDFYSTVEKMKCNNGKFIELSSNGTVKFESGKIRLPKSLIYFSAYIYESLMVPGISIVRPAENMLRMDDGKFALLLDGQRKIVLNADLKDVSGYIAVWIRNNKGGADAVVSCGKTYKQALNQHRKAVIREMVKWVNETKQVGFVLGLSKVSHMQAPEYVMKYIEKQF